ncbi:MAG: nucleotidyltransferase family protein [Candidatus Omnitrophica bacterium]|nr:nucleotidyltransferase family protein [Candidatus Omnitrophota bacterium]
MKDVSKTFISKDKTIEEAMQVIQESGVSITLVVDENRQLIGTITDGDVRRTLLKKIPLGSSLREILANRPPNYPQSTVALEGTTPSTLLDIMEQKGIRHIPLVDKEGRVVDLALLRELVEEKLPLHAVVMAGGKGERLHPLTKEMPKPMLPLDDRPMLEHIIHQLQKSDINDIYIATNYKAEIIQNHFDQKDTLGVSVNCISENRPLGTAGALSLMDPVPNKPTVVINGDILTQLDFRAMYDFHRQHKADMTVGVRIYDIEIPYGVIEVDDIFIKRIVEKPVQKNVVNAGVYILEPLVYQYVKKDKHIDMTELVELLVRDNKNVVGFPIQEYWLDVGDPTSYAQAQEDIKNGKFLTEKCQIQPDKLTR